MCIYLDIFVNAMQNAIPVGFIFKWQELIGAFLGVFLPLLI